MTSVTRDGGDRRQAAAGAVGPDRELVRLRVEDLALKGELIGLRLAGRPDHTDGALKRMLLCQDAPEGRPAPCRTAAS
jgi:hypothetical protein